MAALITKKVSQYQVVLDRDLFFPGERVTGKCLLKVSDAINCRAVNVRLEGKGKADGKNPLESPTFDKYDINAI
jgi:hypothetical protein